MPQVVEKLWKMYVYMLLKKQKLTVFSIKKYTKTKLKIYKSTPDFVFEISI